MCHSDHHLMTGGIPLAGFPVLGGREGSGVVIELGEGVTDFGGRRPCGALVRPVVRQVPVLQARWPTSAISAPTPSSGREAVSDHTFRIHTAKVRNVYPMTLLGTFSPYMVVTRGLGGEDRQDILFEVAALVGCGVPPATDRRRSGDVRLARRRDRRCRRVGTAALQGAVIAEGTLRVRHRPSAVEA